MIFATTVKDVGCLCQVDNYRPASPMRTTGSGFGDADPPEEVEFDYTLLDGDNQTSEMLADLIDESVDVQLLREFRNLRSRG